MHTTNKFRKLPAALMLAGLCAATGPAFADLSGGPGALLAIGVNQSSSDMFQHRGKLVIEEANQDSQEYLFGGVRCSGRNLTDNDVQLLSRLVGNRSVKVAPFYKNGILGTRCIVGYIIGESDAIEVIQQ